MENLILDNLSFANDKEILKTTNNEKLLFSDNIIKINRYNMSQERTFLITASAVYNLKKKSLKRKIEEYKGKAVIETIITSKSTKNLNDLKIALYIGIIVTKFKPARIIIDSKDRDYSALFTALNELDIKNIELNQGDMKTRQDRRAIGAYFKLRSLLKYPEVISLKNFKTIMMNAMHLDNNSADMIIKRLEQLNYIEFTDNRYYKEIRLNR